MKPLKIIDIVKSTNAIDYTSANRFDLITSVEFNSKNCKPGSLFIPLKTGKTDGHLYINDAIKNGATATLWSNSQESAPENISCIFVDDTLEAFQNLAKYYLEHYHPMRVVGITGSNGKTTTKDMIESILKTSYQTYKTQGNYNNEIGVPKTIMDAPENTQIIVVEMGMSNFKEIELLSTITKPEISVITLIGESHLEFLKSREGIAKAKLEILSGMSHDSILIVPHDEPLLNIPIEHYQLQTFGTEKNATLTISNIQSHAQETTFFDETDHISIALPIIGSYNAKNAAAAILVGKYFNISIENIKNALAHFSLTKNRVEWINGINHSKILNDAYNASPTSMKAILNDFQSIDGNKIIVLGGMKELGENSEQLHESIFENLDLNLFKKVFLFGKEMKSAFVQLSQKYSHISFEETSLDKLFNALVPIISKDDYILIKSSFSTNLLDLVNKLKISEQ